MTRVQGHQQAPPAGSRKHQHGLVKEIGRLRLQLYQAQVMEQSLQRCAFLRKEISVLKSQLQSFNTRN